MLQPWLSELSKPSQTAKGGTACFGGGCATTHGPKQTQWMWEVRARRDDLESLEPDSRICLMSLVMIDFIKQR